MIDGKLISIDPYVRCDQVTIHGWVFERGKPTGNFEIDAHIRHGINGVTGLHRKGGDKTHDGLLVIACNEMVAHTERQPPIINSLTINLVHHGLQAKEIGFAAQKCVVHRGRQRQLMAAQPLEHICKDVRIPVNENGKGMVVVPLVFDQVLEHGFIDGQRAKRRAKVFATDIEGQARAGTQDTVLVLGRSMIRCVLRLFPLGRWPCVSYLS